MVLGRHYGFMSAHTPMRSYPNLPMLHLKWDAHACRSRSASNLQSEINNAVIVCVLKVVTWWGIQK